MRPARMSDSIVVITKIAAMFLVMLLGYAARRRDRIDAGTTALLGALTADVCLPALTFTQLLATVDAQRLAAGWIAPLFGAGVLLLGQLLGKLLWRVFATPGQAPTFVFSCATANWIYLPLPIVVALYGAAGVEALLLANVGSQLVLWSVGIATLRGGRLDREAMKKLVTNPGLLAALAGIAAALVLPRGNAVSGPLSHVGRAVLEAITLIGSLTIPLSLLVTGAQLGATRISARPSRASMGVVLVRLFISPAIVLVLSWIARRAGVTLPSPVTAIAILVAAMPVAVSTGILTAKYGQDTKLAAESIFLTTLGSVATVPVVVWVFQRLG